MKRSDRWYAAGIVLLVVIAGACYAYLEDVHQRRWETQRMVELSAKEGQLNPFDREELRQLMERAIKRKIKSRESEPFRQDDRR